MSTLAARPPQQAQQSQKRKTILLCIDSLGPGGAQRQLCLLARLLKKQGYPVCVVIYHDIEFFRYLLDAACIPLIRIKARNKFDRIVKFRRLIDTVLPDVIITYLENPSLLAELATHSGNRARLIVSERNDHLLKNRWKHWLRLQFHRRADAVVTNSGELSRSVLKLAAWLRPRVHTIVNCVDLEKFASNTEKFATIRNEKSCRILVVARFAEQKNPYRLIKAVHLLQSDHPELAVSIDWYGNQFFVDGKPSKFSRCYLQTRQMIKEYGLQKQIRLYDTVEDVAQLYRQYEVFCLPSLHEGCSNVIAEAMACGLPILASRISANHWLVEEDGNGLLFDPYKPKDIAATLKRYIQLDAAQRQAMSQISRQRAEQLLSPEQMVQAYIDLIEV